MSVAAEKITWSKSQASSFRECRRKYVFSTTPFDAALQSALFKEVPFLKKLKNRFMWSGVMVHDAIGDILKELRQGTAEFDADARVAQIREKMREEFQSSREKNEGASRLLEHEYGFQLAPAAWQIQWSLVEKSVLWFLTSPWFARLKTLGPESWKAVDEVLSFDVDGVLAYVKIDCGLQIKNRFILIDWKTGKPNLNDEKNSQTAALYANQVWDADPAHIDAFVVSLAKGTSRRVLINEEGLEQAKGRIKEESALMRAALPPAGNSLIDPFQVPGPADLDQCGQCNFQRLCHAN